MSPAGVMAHRCGMVCYNTSAIAIGTSNIKILDLGWVIESSYHMRANRWVRPIRRFQFFLLKYEQWYTSKYYVRNDYVKSRGSLQDIYYIN